MKTDATSGCIALHPAKNVAGVLPIIVGLLIATGRYLFALRSSQMGTDSSAKTPVGRSYLAWRFSLPLTS